MAKNSGQDQGDELLEQLAEGMRYQYISDLRETRHKKECSRALAKIRPEDYSLSMWRDAAWYVTGKECGLNTPEDVKEWILERLKE